MDFSSLVLIERDNEGKFLKEHGSYKVNQGAEFVTKFYMSGSKLYIEFSTGRDVEEWEYSAIYDLMSIENIENSGYKVEEMLDEYNPSWRICFDFNEDHNEMEDKINDILDMIDEDIEKVMEDIKGKEEQYTE